MKKLTILVILIAGYFVSCKKAYTCDCVLTFKEYNPAGVQTTTYKNTSTTYSEKMKEKQADAACQHEAEATRSTFEALLTNNGTVPPSTDYSYEATCTLK